MLMTKSRRYGMKVLGISGSPRKKGMTAQVIQKLLEGLNHETEYVSLAGKRISPCISCLACAKDFHCHVNDDMEEIREKLMEADLVILGSSNIFDGMSSLTRAFLERFYQFYHKNSGLLKGKKVVAVGTGGGNGNAVISGIEGFTSIYGMEMIGHISATGPVPCISCGFGDTCSLSNAPYAVDPDLEKQPQLLSKIESLTGEINRIA